MAAAKKTATKTTKAPKSAPKATKKVKAAPATPATPKESNKIKFKDFLIFKKRSGRFEVRLANGKTLNGFEKSRVLVEAKLVKTGLPKAGTVDAPPPPPPAAEATAEETPAE